MIDHPKFMALARDIANANGYTLEEIREKHRNPAAVAVRRAVAHALIDAGASFSEAGRVMQRDHTSVMNLVKGKTQPARKVRVA